MTAPDSRFAGRHAREQDPRDPEFCRCGLGLDAWVHTDSDRYVSTTLTSEKWAELRDVWRVSVGRLLLGDDHLPLVPGHVERLLSGDVVDSRPIEIAAAGEAFVIRNGRHRFLAAVLAGRLEIDCVLQA